MATMLCCESRSTLLDECLERFVHGKNVFVSLPTQKRVYAIPVTGSEFTVVI